MSKNINNNMNHTYPVPISLATSAGYESLISLLTEQNLLSGTDVDDTKPKQWNKDNNGDFIDIKEFVIINSNQDLICVPNASSAIFYDPDKALSFILKIMDNVENTILVQYNNQQTERIAGIERLVEFMKTNGAKIFNVQSEVIVQHISDQHFDMAKYLIQSGCPTKRQLNDGTTIKNHLESQLHSLNPSSDLHHYCQELLNYV